MVAHTCNPTLRWKQEISEFETSLGYVARPCQERKRGVLHMAQVIECLLHNSEALSSNPSSVKREEGERAGIRADV
jgi:hypothetical protein